MWILQTSDIHLVPKAEDTLDSDILLELMNRELKAVIGPDEDLVVVVCGDITFKAHEDGYLPALIFFREMVDALGRRITFCLCPGNHDIIVKGREFFQPFNSFAWDLTHEPSYAFFWDSTTTSRIIDDVAFISVNSAHHGEHTYGLVNLDHMEQILEETSSPNKMILTHHHSIPAELDDKSSIANAYGFLHLCCHHGCAAVLHGHRHQETILSVGKNNCKLIGVGSLLYPPIPNINNQFNLLNYQEGSVVQAYNYRFVRDLHRSGRTGSFEKMSIGLY